MSLGLPDFGSRGREASTSSVWRAIQVLGFLALAYAVVVAALEWRSASESSSALARAGAEAARSNRSADEARRALRKNADLLGATASIESSPSRVLEDLNSVLPAGVSIPSVKIDYGPEAVTRLDISVVARTPQVYDRFLNALAKSPLFAEIKPGAEVRPGLVRATLTALHRPKGAAPNEAPPKAALPSAGSPSAGSARAGSPAAGSR